MEDPNGHFPLFWEKNNTQCDGCGTFQLYSDAPERPCSGDEFQVVTTRIRQIPRSDCVKLICNRCRAEQIVYNYATSVALLKVRRT